MRWLRASYTSLEKSLDNANAHLVDQSRRIDESNKHIDMVKESLENRFEALRASVAGDLKSVGSRLDQLFEVVVRREEHFLLANRDQALEQKLAELENRDAA